MQGRIIKGIGGFYYVHCPEAGQGGDRDGAVYECRAKGIFRKDNLCPLVGDEVEIDVLDSEKKLGNISRLLPRHSRLIRPAVANADQALVIFSAVKPRPNFNLLDRFLIMMGQQNLPCIICFNKVDIDEEQTWTEYGKVYGACMYPTLGVSAKTGQGMEELEKMLAGRVTTVAGPSGVGKSSVINCLQSDIVMETGDISTKIERGKHTTRHSELIALGKDTYIMDTPGFSSLGLFELQKGELASFYPEFSEWEENCRFVGCAHVGERLCGVKDAVEEGKISRMRYENYCLLYQELDHMQSRRGGRNPNAARGSRKKT